MEDDLNLFANRRRLLSFSNGRQSHFFLLQMEDDLYLFVNGRQPNFLVNGRQPSFCKMENNDFAQEKYEEYAK